MNLGRLNGSELRGRRTTVVGESPAVRLVLVGSFHLTIGLARRGDHLSLRSNFFASGGTSGIASQGIFARVERSLVTLRRILTKVFFCFVFHKRLVMLVYQVFNEPGASVVSQTEPARWARD